MDYRVDTILSNKKETIIDKTRVFSPPTRRECICNEGSQVPQPLIQVWTSLSVYIKLDGKIIGEDYYFLFPRCFDLTSIRQLLGYFNNFLSKISFYILYKKYSENYIKTREW